MKYKKKFESYFISIAQNAVNFVFISDFLVVANQQFNNFRIVMLVDKSAYGTKWTMGPNFISLISAFGFISFFL